MSTYDLKFVADVTGMAAGLAKIPGMADAAAAKSALKQVEQNRAAAKKAAKDQEDAAKKAQSGWSTAFKGIAKVAGLGEMTEKVGALSGGMEGAALASGAAVAGVVAIGVAAAGAAAGAVSLARGARDAIDQIDKLGVTDIITDTQRENIADANAGLDAIGVGAGAVEAALASGLAPAIAKVSAGIVSLELFGAKVVGTFSTGALTFDAWSAALLVALTPVKLAIDGLDMMNRALGISNPGIEASAQLVDGWASSLADSAVSVHADTAAKRESLAVSTDAAKAIEQVGIANEKSTEAYRKHAEAVKRATEAYRTEIDALKELGQIGQKAGEDQLDAAGKLAVARDDEIVKINEVEAKALAAAKLRGDKEDELTAITETAAAARSDVEARYARDQVQIIADDYAARAAEVAKGEAFIQSLVGEAAASKVVKPWQAAQAEVVKGWGKISDAVGPYLDGLSQIADAAGTIASMEQDYHTRKLAHARAELKAAQKNGDAGQAILSKEVDHQEKAAKRAFRGGQLAAIAGAVIAGAQLALAMIPGIALAMGPAAAGAPLVAAGIAGVATAAQIGVIAAQKPPKFARGGEVQVTAEGGEIIANKRAANTPGVKDMINAANEGRISSAGGGGNATSVFLNDRLIMTIMARGFRLGGMDVPGQWTRGMA